jgi:uroporphyrinogen-III synthase
MIRLAVLRPEPGNAATAGRIEALGPTAIRLPLFAVRALDWTPPDPGGFDALLLTSANAIRCGGPGLDLFRHLPVFTVGARTAETARSAGFDVKAAGASDAISLLALAEAHGVSRALHLTGRDRSIDAGGPVSCGIAVYASEALPIDDGRLRGLEGSVALLHSARAARRLGELLAGRGMPRSAIGIAALSPAVAAAAGAGWASVVVAAAPNDAALIEAARIEGARTRLTG